MFFRFGNGFLLYLPQRSFLDLAIWCSRAYRRLLFGRTCNCRRCLLYAFQRCVICCFVFGLLMATHPLNLWVGYGWDRCVITHHLRHMRRRKCQIEFVRCWNVFILSRADVHIGIFFLRATFFLILLFKVFATAMSHLFYCWCNYRICEGI